MSSVALLALLAAARPAGAPDAETLIRSVIANQRRAERSLPPHTYDQVSVETTYGRDGHEKSVERKVYAVTSPGHGVEGTRELIEVNGRPATAREKRQAAEEDARARQRRIDHRAAAQAAHPPRPNDDENDPELGPRKLSEVLALYDYRLENEEVHDGRRCYVLAFHPKPDSRVKTVGDRALAALEGRVVVDVQDLQVRAATAHLVKPVHVAGGIVANVKSGEVLFEAQRIPAPSGGYWLPSRIDFRLTGSTALVFRLDKGWRFRMGNFRRFSVSTESSLGRGGP